MSDDEVPDTEPKPLIAASDISIRDHFEIQEQLFEARDQIEIKSEQIISVQELLNDSMELNFKLSAHRNTFTVDPNVRRFEPYERIYAAEGPATHRPKPASRDIRIALGMPMGDQSFQEMRTKAEQELRGLRQNFQLRDSAYRFLRDNSRDNWTTLPLKRDLNDWIRPPRLERAACDFSLGKRAPRAKADPSKTNAAKISTSRGAARKTIAKPTRAPPAPKPIKPDTPEPPRASHLRSSTRRQGPRVRYTQFFR
ncbi:unnamed protein product, partial [Mesorhabditis spiculigera]